MSQMDEERREGDMPQPGNEPGGGGTNQPGGGSGGMNQPGGGSGGGMNQPGGGSGGGMNQPGGGPGGMGEGDQSKEGDPNR